LQVFPLFLRIKNSILQSKAIVDHTALRERICKETVDLTQAAGIDLTKEDE
jgi:hypothetical protein